MLLNRGGMIPRHSWYGWQFRRICASKVGRPRNIRLFRSRPSLNAEHLTQSLSGRRHPGYESIFCPGRPGKDSLMHSDFVKVNLIMPRYTNPELCRYVLKIEILPKNININPTCSLLR